MPAPPSQNRHFVPACGALCCAAVLLYIAAWLFSNTREQLEEWERCPGVVVDAEWKTRGAASRSRIYYYPHIEFTSADGQRHRILAQTSHNSKHYRVGAKVEVLCPPGKPEKAELYSFRESWLWCSALALVGGFQALFGAGLLLYCYRNEPRVRAWLERLGWV